MFGGSKAVIGLDVGSYSVKAVALQSNRDRVTLQGYAQVRIDNQDVGEVVRKVLGQLGVKAKRVVTSVSGRSVIVRQVDTPKLKDEELKQHITYEADKYIPFGTEEVIIDCQPMPPRPGGDANSQSVMLVAVRKGLIHEHLASLRSAGVQPEIIDVDVFALANAYELFGPPMPPETEHKAVAVIDIGASKSNIAIVQSERVLFTREVYLAGNEISDAIARTLNYQPEDVDAMKLAPGESLDAIIDAAMPAFEDLANEIRLSFDYVEGQFDTEVSSVILTGGSSQLPSVAGILGNILTRPVHVFDPLAGIDLVPSKYDIHGLDANSPGLTVALGLAAHLLDHPARSLGGQQSLNWQPRSRTGDLTVAAAPMTEEVPAVTEDTTYAPAEEAAPVYADEDTAETVPTAAPLDPTPPFRAPPAFAAPPPPPPAFAAPPPPAFVPPPPPPVAMAVPPPPPGRPSTPVESLDPLDLPEGGAVEGSTTSVFNEKNRSSLLVVLDDDQDVPSERIQKHTASIKRNTSGGFGTTSGFGEDDSKPGLPDLPDLPSKF